VVLVIILIAWNVNTKAAGTEGFQDASPGLNIPLISPRQQTLMKGEVKDFAPPSTELLAPPPGQLASVNTRPAEDPAMEKSKLGRIQSVYESLQGFFDREEPGLSKMGDPSVQLPLTTARGDRARLRDELGVLKRNPGLNSSLTEEDLNGIEGNLAYLQRKWRNSVNSGALPMPPEHEAAEEGFLDMKGSSKRGWFSWFFGGAQEGFQTGSAAGTPAGGSKESDVSLKDLEDIALKINVEILRLESSGSTDMNTTARIDRLSTTMATVNQLISEIKKGEKTTKEIPFMRADVATYLPAMSNLNTPLPDLISKSGMSDILNSLFPLYNAGDVSGAMLSRELLNQYGRTLLSNLSWDVNLKYKGQAEQDIAKNYADAMMQGKQMAEQELEAARVNATVPPVNETTRNAYRGMFESIISDLTGKGVSSSVTVSGGSGAAGSAAEGGEEPTKDSPGMHKGFDWKARSIHICNQISKRNMDPNDFGCLKNPEAEKYQGFSWRGYAKMVCNRLGTVYDTSVPELCGCPPPTWVGWRA